MEGIVEYVPSDMAEVIRAGKQHPLPPREHTPSSECKEEIGRCILGEEKTQKGVHLYKFSWYFSEVTIFLFPKLAQNAI